MQTAKAEFVWETLTFDMFEDDAGLLWQSIVMAWVSECICI